MTVGLNAQQERFVAEYLIDLNATQAATRAGYSAKTAYSQGQRLLKNVEIAAAIEAAQAERSQRTNITADRVLLEMARIGFADVRKIFTPGGALLPPVDMDDETAAAVASVEVVERRLRGENGETEVEHVRKIKMNDKLGALTQMGRHLGLFTDKLEVNASGELAERLARARGRAG